MKKILFVIHNLNEGGAQKVLINLVNNLDQNRFDITVLSLFGGGVNAQFLNKNIKYQTIFPKIIRGNRILFKIFNPETLFKLFVHGEYDYVISYLEGITARILSGCRAPNTKKISWIHVEQHSITEAARSFRSPAEAIYCYNQFDKTICVSQYVHDDFCKIFDFHRECIVLYNTVESDKILQLSTEYVEDIPQNDCINLIAVGSLKESKGYDRLLPIIKNLRQDNHNVHLYILGIGPLENTLKEYVKKNCLTDSITFLGYQTNPYKYVSKCDLFVCASRAEGFSTAATEALIVGTPVCTVDVSGMKEMLGYNNEYGMVCNNTEEDLQSSLAKLISNPELLQYYKMQAQIRGQFFNKENTVRAVEEILN